jgi:shikimate dehydrogenase
LKITGNTKIVGIMGHPVGHTLSPTMQNAAFAAAGLDYCYLPFDTPPERLPAAVEGLRAVGVRGFNVTIPHKETIVPLLDRLTDEAKRIGAVNAVQADGDLFVGHNTDGKGFLRSLMEEGGIDPRGVRVLILGAGGAARAVAFALADAGAGSIRIANRTAERGKTLAEALRAALKGSPIQVIPWQRDPEIWEESLAEADLLVNATSVGMGSDSSPVPAKAIHPKLVVCDLVYRPLETSLLKAARSRGAKALSGLGMLLYQGTLSFEIWTERPAPVSVMREALLSELEFC